MVIIIVVALWVLSVLLIRVLRGLYSESLLELKRRARSGDVLSAKLYKLKSSYTIEPEILIVFITMALLSFSSLLVVRNYPAFNAYLIVLLSYLLVPLFGFIGEQSMRIASSSSIILEVVLRILGPVLRYPAQILGKLIAWGPKKTFSSKDELLNMVDQNGVNSKLSMQEKRAIQGALTYGDKKVKQIMIPNSVVKQISFDEVLSPVIINELHDSGYSRFPVYDKSKNVVGTLFIKDAINLRNTKLVSEIMRPEVFYLNEEQSLQDALKAFLKTKHHLFMVVNEYEDVVGIVTIEDVLEQIIGEKIIDEFDQYEDMKVMAQRLAQQKREERT